MLGTIDLAMIGGRRIAIEPASWPHHDLRRLTFSPGVEADGTLWLSGHTAARLDPISQRPVVQGDIVEQALAIYEKIRTIIEAAELDLNHVVRVVDYVTLKGRQDYHRIVDLRRHVFRTRPPVASVIIVDDLLRSGALIEIEALAARNLGIGNVLEGYDRDAHSACTRGAGDVIYLPTLSGIGPSHRETTWTPGILEQTQHVYESARQILAGRGLSLKHIAKVIEFLTPEAHKQYGEIRKVREALVGRNVATTTIVMAEGMNPKSLLQVEFAATTNSQLVQHVDKGDTSKDRAAFVRCGQVAFVSGQRAWSQVSNNVLFPGDVVSQARVAYHNLAAALSAAGVGLESVVHTTEFVTPAGLAGYRETANVRREIFKPPYPAATGIVCKELMEIDALIEVDAVAILESKA